MVADYGDVVLSKSGGAVATTGFATNVTPRPTFFIGADHRASYSTIDPLTRRP